MEIVPHSGPARTATIRATLHGETNATNAVARGRETSSEERLGAHSRLGQHSRNVWRQNWRKRRRPRRRSPPVEKQDAMEEEAQNALGPSPATPDRQKQLADLDATISRLNSDPDPEIQAIVSKRRAQREELVLQLRAAKPLPVQSR